MTLSLRWIEDAEKRPRRLQTDLFAPMRLCCNQVAQANLWSWGRAARAIRRALEMEPGASMRGIRVEGAALFAITAPVRD